MLPLAFLYNTIKGVADLATGAFNTVGTVVARAGTSMHARPTSHRHNPISTSGRRNKTPKKTSMLDLPPHLVGATP